MKPAMAASAMQKYWTRILASVCRRHQNSKRAMRSKHPCQCFVPRPLVPCMEFPRPGSKQPFAEPLLLVHWISEGCATSRPAAMFRVDPPPTDSHAIRGMSHLRLKPLPGSAHEYSVMALRDVPHCEMLGNLDVRKLLPLPEGLVTHATKAPWEKARVAVKGRTEELQAQKALQASGCPPWQHHQPKRSDSAEVSWAQTRLGCYSEA